MADVELLNAARRGFVYEQNLVNLLKKHKYVPAGFQPAASENRPDIVIQNVRGTAGCEVKISTNVAGGSVNFIHDRGKWRFDGRTKMDEQKFLIGVAKKAGFLQQVQEEWSTPPIKRTPVTSDLTALMGKMTREQIYRADLEACHSFTMKVSPKVLEKYYNAKNAQYINIGTHGLYLLGPSDPLGMNASLGRRKMKKVPRFSDVATMTLIAQVKNKGAGKWHQFMLEARFNIPLSAKSPYNLGATNGTDAVINLSKTDLSCFL